jgi:hypothetical protein
MDGYYYVYTLESLSNPNQISFGMNSPFNQNRNQNNWRGN